MPNRKRIVYKGKEYESIKELARVLNMSYSTVYSRLRSGMGVEDVVKKPIDAVKNGGKRVVYRGMEYRSSKDLAGALNINYDTFRARVNKGMCLTEAVENPIIEMRKEVMHKGIKYRSIKKLAEQFNIKYNTLFYRIASGMSVEEAIEKGPGKGSVVFKGKEYKNLKQLAKECGVEYASLMARLKRGMSVEEAIETPMRERRKD